MAQKTVASALLFTLFTITVTACNQPMTLLPFPVQTALQAESPLLPTEITLLTKHPWRVVTIIHQNEPVSFDAIQPIYVSISLDGLSAETTNCNQLSFGLNSTGNQQYQLGEGFMTEMLCRERQTKQYDDFYRALSPTTRFERQGEELRLIGEASEIVLEATYPFNLAHPVFTQNRWQLLEITYQGQPVIFDAIRPIYLEITEDGHLHLKTAQCNLATFTMVIKSEEYYQLAGGNTSYECPQIPENQSYDVFWAVSRTNTLKLNGTQLLLTGPETRVVLEVDNAQ